jgi:DNA replication protein DnaC
MKATEAHARLSLLIDGGHEFPNIAPANEAAPLLAAALATLSGQLGDADDDTALIDAVVHGSALFDCGVIDADQWGDAVVAVFGELEQAIADSGGEQMGTLLADVPKPLRLCELSNYRIYHANQPLAMATLVEHLEALPQNLKTGRGLTLAGMAGTGKSHVAIGMGKEAVRRWGLDVRYVEAPWFCAREAAEQRRRGADLVRAELLIVDGLRPEMFKADVTIMRLLAARLTTGLITWFATTCTSRDDALLLYGRLLANLTRNSEGVAFVWPSYRLLTKTRIENLPS